MIGFVACGHLLIFWIIIHLFLFFPSKLVSSSSLNHFLLLCCPIDVVGLLFFRIKKKNYHVYSVRFLQLADNSGSYTKRVFRNKFCSLDSKTVRTVFTVDRNNIHRYKNARIRFAVGCDSMFSMQLYRLIYELCSRLIIINQQQWRLLAGFAIGWCTVISTKICCLKFYARLNGFGKGLWCYRSSWDVADAKSVWSWRKIVESSAEFLYW